MQTTSATEYSIYLGVGGDSEGGTLNFTAEYGATDDSVIALAEALRDFPWPSAQQPVQILVSRGDTTLTSYAADLNITPATFT